MLFKFSPHLLALSMQEYLAVYLLHCNLRQSPIELAIINKKTEILSEQEEAIRILLPIMKNTSLDFGFGFRRLLRWQEKDGDLLSQ